MSASAFGGITDVDLDLDVEPGVFFPLFPFAGAACGTGVALSDTAFFPLVAALGLALAGGTDVAEDVVALAVAEAFSFLG